MDILINVINQGDFVRIQALIVLVKDGVDDVGVGDFIDIEIELEDEGEVSINFSF